MLAAGGVVALLAGALSGVFTRQSSAPDGETLLAVTLPDVDGTHQSLAQWRGKLVVVNFGATWCAPCREEMPMFVKAQREHAGAGLQFVGIAVDDAANARQFAKDIGVNYPNLIGGYGAMELSKTLGNTVMALPFTVVVDRTGRIVLTQLGPIKQAQLDQLIKKAL